jgi:membrane-bound serine protease (ClpP class)
MAAHVAAMAPGTNIGAAHPVQIGPSLPGGGDEPPDRDQKKEKKSEPSTMEQKAVNDTVAWIRSLAELRGRNAEWAARAVTESISAPATEALENRVVDLIAQDQNELLKKLDGREIRMPAGTRTLKTTGALVVSKEMWWGERILSAIANPTVAFLLLMFGFYGILFELYAPGWGIPGTVGLVCLVLGFFAMSVLPIDLVGLTLILLAMGLFGAEAFVPSHGMLTVAGIICLVLGGLMLVDSPEGFQRVSLWALIPVALATAAVATILVGSVVRSRREALQSKDPLMGEAAIADGDFVNLNGRMSGRIRIHGELWNGVSDQPVGAGQEVVIAGREGLTLKVRPAGPEKG